MLNDLTKTDWLNILVLKDHTWATRFWQAVGYENDPHMARFVRNLAVKQ
jgi:hypothetical protein